MKPDIKTLIIYEDPHILVCHKPAGVPVQSARITAADMVSLLKNHLTGTNTAGNRNKAPYLAVIHRLDQPVEGLLVFAKTPAAAKDLNRQLTSSGFAKYYRSTAAGVPEPAEGTLEDYIVKDGRTNTSHICTKETPGAKLARLHYQVVKIYKGTQPVTSLVKIKLDTGRHHQIRVQMAHLGCPLVGDRKYGKLFGNSQNIEISQQEQLMLCACRLEFRHPVTRQKLVFELPDN